MHEKNLTRGQASYKLYIKGLPCLRNDQTNVEFEVMSSSPPFSAPAAGRVQSLPPTLEDDLALFPADTRLMTLWNTNGREPETVVGAFQHSQDSVAETKMEGIDSGIIFAPDPQYQEGKEEWGWDEKAGHRELNFDDFTAWQPTMDLTQMILSEEATTSGFDIRLDDDTYIEANKNSALNVFGV
jgi:hypothetical protein